MVAEDLGLITPDVIALREQLGLPGMRVLQFALNGPHDIHWPHNYVPNTVGPDYDLKSALAPLELVKGEVSVVSGLRIPTANGMAVYTSGKVTLPNKQTIALDPTHDKDSQEKRDTWLRSQAAHP